MSAPVGVEGLIAKWRRYADGNFDDAANARSRCADDLEAALAAQQPAPAAPVGVEELNSAAVDAGHCTWESLRQCANAWRAVVGALTVVAPGWNGKNSSGQECAVTAIQALAKQPAPCDMGNLCIGCEPRNADGSCPDGRQPAAATRCDDCHEPTGPLAVCGTCADIRCDAVSRQSAADEQCRRHDCRRVRAEMQAEIDRLKQPAAVDGAMARRLDDYLGGEFDIRIGKQAAHAALHFALAGQQGGA